ncbi:hypothetical protein GGE67_006056 [Rhizobium leucaenae]|nr:hypothetical protein [Rhizobium leucaenae]
MSCKKLMLFGDRSKVRSWLVVSRVSPISYQSKVGSLKTAYSKGRNLGCKELCSLLNEIIRTSAPAEQRRWRRCFRLRPYVPITS